MSHGSKFYEKQGMERVEIRIKGEIDEHWSEWFDGLAITHTRQNESLLLGSVKDQAALYGLLIRLRDLNLALVSVDVLDD